MKMERSETEQEYIGFHTTRIKAWRKVVRQDGWIKIDPDLEFKKRIVEATKHIDLDNTTFLDLEAAGYRGMYHPNCSECGKLTFDLVIFSTSNDNGYDEEIHLCKGCLQEAINLL